MGNVLNSGIRTVSTHRPKPPRWLPLLALATLFTWAACTSAGAQQKSAVSAKSAPAVNPPETPSPAAGGQDWKQQSAQLLLLATQLKHEVDHTTENILSVKVIEKAKQIEQLTRVAQQELKAAN